MKDDNPEIMTLLNERLQIGRDRYGHGIRVMDDTRSWGTPADSWAEMGLEEALDLCLYLSAALVRIRRTDEITHADPKNIKCKACGIECSFCRHNLKTKKVGLIGRALSWIKSHF